MDDQLMPKYLQIKNEILTWINANSLYITNGLLPPEMWIAKNFNVSRQTVRQALGILEREGYVTRHKGKGTFVRTMKKSDEPDSKTIALVTTNLSNHNFPSIIKGVDETLRNRGYKLLLCSSDGDKKKEGEHIKNLTCQPIGGMIIEPTKSAHKNENLSLFLGLANKNIPYVMINERYPELSCPCIKVDDEEAGFLAGEHLITLGHRRIAGFFKTDDLQGVHRLKGFIRAHNEFNLALNPDLILTSITEETDWKTLNAFRFLLQDSIERPTAFVCYDDEVAIKLLEILRKKRLKVPEDISILSFEESSLATATEVKLTCLKQLKKEMGIQATKIILDMIEGKQKRWNQEILYQSELIIRNSTKRNKEVLK
ncbi:GntR family transcriptional regulator [Mesobacillus foraminis]|uniref:GntR family transcriptional regulator of arabinose operon n=1 Tax=Mesobacillus foraminis TaxID=279826 RepID=A0A4R2B3Z6_9BACI|nr:GntR family transcriptional regulator [Mesobacillus foraminis]TCN21156.1 GntR family transcriptional regulator of arabinose operon [Mesobacillus foraminis]